MSYFFRPLYMPTDPPALPSVKLGRIRIDGDTDYKIRGVGPYADDRPMRRFEAAYFPRIIHFLDSPEAPAGTTSVFHRILCEAVPVYTRGRDTFDVRIVVSEPAHQELVRTLGREWYA